MNRYLTLGYRLPHFLSSPLFGDRKRWGLTVNDDDQDWVEWNKAYLDFYYANQKASLGAIVNNAGYQVMEQVDFSGKHVLEIGPGDIRHLPYWWEGNSALAKTPPSYVIADINPDMLERSSSVLEKAGISHETKLIQRSESSLPFEDESFDTIVSFYALEHIYPLGPYLDELFRILKPGGQLVGGIPSEGGLAWGFGRYLTSRRWFKKNTTIDPDKIICWEHPNFAELILRLMDEKFERQYFSAWPLQLPVLDINLVIKFIYRKS